MLDGKGNVEEHLEVYTDYLAKQQAIQAEEQKEQKVEKPKAEKPKNEKKKLSFKEQKEWETIADDIAGGEQKIEDTEAKIATAGSDFTLLQNLTAELDELNARYEYLIERMFYLDEIVNG